MPVNFNQPYGELTGAGPARYVQGGVYYRADGTTVTTSPTEDDLTPSEIAHQQVHDALGVVTAQTNPLTGGA